MCAQCESCSIPALILCVQMVLVNSVQVDSFSLLPIVVEEALAVGFKSWREGETSQGTPSALHANTTEATQIFQR